MALSPRYLVAVNLVLLALAAYSASAIVGTALEGWLMRAPEIDLSPPPPPLPPEEKKSAAHYARIKTRDIFNSVKPVEAPPPAPAAPPLAPLKLKLWGVALHDRGDSYCIIEDQSLRKQELYRVNDSISGATIKSIEWDRVVLNRGGQDEILQLESTVATGAAQPAQHAFARPVPLGTTSDGRIQALSDSEYAVDRSQVDDALQNMSQLFTQIRAVPHFEGGKATGFRLFAIRSGSLFDRIGLKNGDIIQSINGSEMTDPARALALLQELRNESALTVEVIRNRQPQTLSYQIR
jgi:general secretion pathway protein C